MPGLLENRLADSAQDLIQSEAAAADAAGCLTPALQQLALDEGWFRLLVPAQYGGAQRSLPELLLLEEALAATDGSLGWTVTLCAGAGWFGGFLEAALAEEIFKHPALCIAGSGAVTGFADVTAGGFVLSGRWAHATGAPIASHFTANCLVRKEGRVLQEAGADLVRAFIVPAGAVCIHPTWNSMGLRASASQAFSITNYAVSEAHAFSVSPEAARVDAPLYRYPFLPLAEATLAINLCGMARHFEAASRPLLERPHRNGRPVSQLERPAGLRQRTLPAMISLRSRLLDAVDESWRRLEAGDLLPDAPAAEIGHLSRQLAGCAQDLVDGLYRCCGLAAADAGSALNRVFRDVHTAGQHSLLL